EEIFMHLPGNEESIMISKWPKFKEDLVFKPEEEEMEIIMETIRSIRNARAEMNVVPSRKATVIFLADNKEVADILSKSQVYFQRLVSASEVIVKTERTGIPENAVTALVDKVEIFIPLDELVDKDKEIERLEKEKDHLEKELKRVNGKLANIG